MYRLIGSNKMVNLNNYYEILKNYGFKMENGSITKGNYVIEPQQNGLILVYHTEHGFEGYAADIKALLHYFKIKTK